MRKKHPYFVGIDMSIVEPGVSYSCKGNVRTKALTMPDHKSFNNPIARWHHVTSQVMAFLKKPLQDKRNCFVLIEDYAAGGKGKTNAIAECTGLLKYKLLYYAYLPVENLKLCSIPHVKMFCCGKGNAKKELMILNVFKKWNFETNNNNEADAYTLMKICETLYKPQSQELTAYQKDILERIKKYNK